MFSVHHEVTGAQRKGALVNEHMLSEYRAFKFTPDKLYDFFESVRIVSASAATHPGVLPAEIATRLGELALAVGEQTTCCCLMTVNEQTAEDNNWQFQFAGFDGTSFALQSRCVYR
jgi:hypothetical protein